MAKGTSGPIRQRAALGMGKKVNVGGGVRNYASGGDLTLEQKRDPRKAAAMAAYARGESSPDDGESVITRAVRAAKKLVGADDGMKTGGTVKRGKAHSDAAQDKKLIRQEIAKAKGKGNMNCGGRTRRK